MHESTKMYKKKKSAKMYELLVMYQNPPKSSKIR